MCEGIGSSFLSFSSYKALAAIYYCGTSLKFPHDGRYPEIGINDDKWNPSLVQPTIEEVRDRLSEVEEHPKFKTSGPDPIMAIIDYIANRMLLPPTNPMRSLFTSVVVGDSAIMKFNVKGSKSLAEGMKSMTGGWGSIFIESAKGATLSTMCGLIRKWKK